MVDLPIKNGDLWWIYPLNMVIYSGITIEHGDLWWIYPLNMVIYSGFTHWIMDNKVNNWLVVQCAHLEK